uniref:Uncharacterized protein n=1 Tax=Aegilops tauschii subsp. strangulata TaxID=200361 RepID=A0A453H7M9_AEGTS
MEMDFFPVGAIGSYLWCNMQLKVFQHELPCTTSVLKVKASGLKSKVHPWLNLVSFSYR